MSETPKETKSATSKNAITASTESVVPDGEEKPEGEGDVEAAEPKGEEAEPERESWSNKLSYFLTLVGYAVGFGNIWRFPYLLHSNGGAAFLIPYCIMLAFEGIPLFFLELAVGQRLRKGALGSWNEISPYLGGLGITCGLTCYLVAFYYNTLIAWVLSYLFDSFRGTLPWTDCKETVEYIRSDENKIQNAKGDDVPEECEVTNQATKYYWFRRALDVSSGITDPGDFNPWVMLYLIISWLTIWGILIKGIESSEKVVYFTALFPYVTLLCFFVGNFFMDGYENGYMILFRPDFSVLIDAKVWLTAGTQIFFSLGVAYGCLIVFASYLPSNNDCYKDAISVSIINCCTSLFAAIVIFPVLGAQGTRKFKECKFLRMGQVLMAVGETTYSTWTETTAKPYYLHKDESEKGWITKYNKDGNWNQLINPFLVSSAYECDLEASVRDSGSGTGLVFIAFAEAAVHLPCPQFWCFLFFFMLFTLGVDSSFGTAEGAIAAVVDMKIVTWPRWVITSTVCGSLLVLSMFFAAGWGIYVQVFLDQFVANWSLLIIAFFETVGISWIYGLAKFSYDIKLMTGRKPNIFMLVCWKYISPVVLLIILIMSMQTQFRHGHTYDPYDQKLGKTEEKEYPPGIVALGYLIWLGVICWVPIQAILQLTGHSLLKVEKPAFFPEEELRAERDMDDETDMDQFDGLDKLVMGKSVEDFMAYRGSKSVTSIHAGEGSDTNNAMRNSGTDSLAIGGDAKLKGDGAV